MSNQIESGINTMKDYEKHTINKIMDYERKFVQQDSSQLKKEVCLLIFLIFICTFGCYRFLFVNSLTREERVKYNNLRN